MYQIKETLDYLKLEINVLLVVNICYYLDLSTGSGKKLLFYS